MTWLRYRIAKKLARWDRYRWYSQAENRYPRSVRGGWRFLREQACPAEVEWYERRGVAR